MTQLFQVRHLALGELSVTTERVQATDERHLRQKLADQGRTVLSVQVVSQDGAWRLPSWKSREVGPQDYALFCREVRTLIQAGMTIVEATDTLSARERLEGRSDSLAAQLLARLQHGVALSSAMNELPKVPLVLIAAIRAGERTSNLAEALDDYLRFDGLVTQLRKKVLSAAIYPGLVTLVGLGISLFLLLVVMPNFATMYENLRSSAGDTPALTIQISRIIGGHRIIVFSTLGVLAAGLAYWIHSGMAKVQVLHWLTRIGWVRQRIEDFQLAMMYQALALLLKGGYPMTDALQVASKSALSTELQSALLAALAQIEQGGLVSSALHREHLCDEVGRRLMAAAERNGSFYLATQVVSRLHGERFELFVERVTRIVEPLLLLAVALVVGGIVVMMYLPVFDMATQLR
jgi:general secretion pathway protein F